MKIKGNASSFKWRRVIQTFFAIAKTVISEPEQYTRIEDYNSGSLHKITLVIYLRQYCDTLFYNFIFNIYFPK